MLISFAVLAAVVAISPAVWFSWWVLADAMESARTRRTAPAVTVVRPAAQSAAAIDRYYDKAA